MSMLLRSLLRGAILIAGLGPLGAAGAESVPKPVVDGTVMLSGAPALGSGRGALPEGTRDDIGPEQRERIWRDLDASVAKLALATPRPKAGQPPKFIWPLRPASGFPHPSFYEISNYVDHDRAFPDKVQDYSCGARTYDTAAGYNHQGTDIALTPDGWNMMEAKAVQIVAAADGTIVYKNDGNFDRNCAFNSLDWNAVYVQHDDGSIAWYGHMKQGSQTAKPVGQRVVAGEFLGNVGSS